MTDYPCGAFVVSIYSTRGIFTGISYLPPDEFTKSSYQGAALYRYQTYFCMKYYVAFVYKTYFIKTGIDSRKMSVPYLDSKVHEANMGPTWVLSDPSRPHIGLMNLTNRVV